MDEFKCSRCKQEKSFLIESSHMENYDEFDSKHKSFCNDCAKYIEGYSYAINLMIDYIEKTYPGNIYDKIDDIWSLAEDEIYKK